MKAEKFNVRRTVSVFCVLLCLLLMAVTFSSCRLNGYGGERLDLYTVAVNNIFGIRGYLSNGEVTYDPEIGIIDTDDHGRVLFFYNEYYDDSTDPQIDYGMAFVIMQKAENGYVYYYRDDCYTPYFDIKSDYDTVLERVDPDLLEELKERNDWNEEFNGSKCTRAKITDEKPEGKGDVQDHELDGIIYPYAKANGYQGTDQRTCKFFEYCNADLYGRELYYVYCMSADDAGNGETVYGTYVYAVIVNSDGEFSDSPIVEIKDPTDSYELIKALKQQNNWNQAD